VAIVRIQSTGKWTVNKCIDIVKGNISVRMDAVGAVIAALVGAVVGGLLTYKTSVNISKRQEFNKAAAAFREAFMNERLFLDFRHAPEESEYQSAFDIIEPAIQKHTEAMYRFSHYLSWWEKRCFSRAWRRYAHDSAPGKGEPDTPFFKMYAERVWEGKNTKELAIERIDRLLKFAKPR
jgi:hypothetical protein